MLDQRNFKYNVSFCALSEKKTKQKNSVNFLSKHVRSKKQNQISTWKQKNNPNPKTPNLESEIGDLSSNYQ